MLNRLKKFDIHGKALEGVHQQTILGAILTIFAAVVVIMLIVSEFTTFFQVDVVSRMVVDKMASSEAVRLNIDISFPYATCNNLEFTKEITKGTIHIVHTEEEGVKKTPMRNDKNVETGCQLTGIFGVDKVGGNFKIGVKNSNFSHIINNLAFDPTVGAMTSRELLDVPRSYVREWVEVPPQTLVYYYNFVIVPTQYKTLAGQLSFINQYSVSEKIISSDLVRQNELFNGVSLRDFNGVMFSYDFNPVMLYMEERREKIIDFLTNLCGIVGGVIVVISLFERFLQTSAKAIIGKKD